MGVPQLFLINMSVMLGAFAQFEGIRYILITGNSPDINEKFQLNETDKLLNHSNFDNDRHTVLYCHGYTESPQSESALTVVTAYIQRNDHNIIVLDWSQYSGGNYATDAVPNSFKVGDYIGKSLISMNNQGFNLDNFHLVGHSMGGQLVGFIGRSVQKNSNNKLILKRISALDPAGPVYYPRNIFMNPLNAADAEFVDVIHTDAILFGAPFETGTVDFWPNNGKSQPECPLPDANVNSEKNFCSHRRSWVYWSESLVSKNSKVFNSVKCKNWDEFKKSLCSRTGMVAYMGIEASPSLRGNYFLQTNSRFSFSRGPLGTSYDPSI